MKEQLFDFADKVTIMGVEYSIELKKIDDDPAFNRHKNANGFMDAISKRIVLTDKRDYPIYKGNEEELECLNVWMKKTLRHEIVHAFLFESGLSKNANFCGSWPVNEEMVDWIAIQGPKMIKAWTEAKAL